MSRILTGIKPSGALHLGNLLGALQPFIHTVHHANTSTSLFGVMDLHALTTCHDPRALPARTRELFALVLAAGINPDRTTVFVQSHVPEHTELAYLIESTVRFGELARMVAFKDQARAAGADGARASLFSYPALMAADILAYQCDLVPVGQDQRQHLELTRTVARRFNQLYGPTFTVPAGSTTTTGARVMNLADPASKMGKSVTGADAGTIFLLDGPDLIRRKIRRAQTDPLGKVIFDPVTQPGVANLIDIAAACAGTDPDTIIGQATTYGALKDLAVDAVIALVTPIQEKYQALVADPDHLGRLMADGSVQARVLAGGTVTRAKEAIGLLPH
ncbi:MAG: tryptophan--tRNA ligase [Propionicimonas sp.]